MARVTVEDCLPHIGNPFDLAMLAAERARQLSEGAPPAGAGEGARPTAGADGHKPAVMALREIAAGGLDERALREAAMARRREAIAAAPDAAPEAETPEPPPGDGFERRNEAAIAAGLEPLPVAGTAKEPPGEDDAPDEAERAA